MSNRRQLNDCISNPKTFTLCPFSLSVLDHCPPATVADTLVDLIGVPLTFRGTVIAHIQYGGREKMILTMPLAVPLATGPMHTQTHTQAHTQMRTICVFPSLEELKRQAHVSPRITFKERLWERFYSYTRKHSQFWFHKTTLSLAVNVSFWLFFLFYCFVVFIPISFCVSEQVVGPPPAGAFRERPTKPTTFRKFYDRGEFPMALEHDTKGNRIAWKVGLLSFSDKCFWSPHTIVEYVRMLNRAQPMNQADIIGRCGPITDISVSAYMFSAMRRYENFFLQNIKSRKSAVDWHWPVLMVIQLFYFYLFLLSQCAAQCLSG